MYFLTCVIIIRTEPRLLLAGILLPRDRVTQQVILGRVLLGGEVKWKATRPQLAVQEVGEEDAKNEEYQEHNDADFGHRGHSND